MIALRTLLHVVVDRGQRVDVVRELVGEQGLRDGRGAVEDVRATIVVLQRRPGDRVESDHQQPVGVQLQGGLQGRVEPHAAVAVPALTDAHGREQRLDRARGLDVLDREPGRDVVDAAPVVGGRRLAAVVEDHASRRRVGGRHDGGRGQRAVLDVARELLEIDQRRDRLRLRAGVEQARRGGRGDAQQLEPVEQQAGELARRAQRADDVADLDLEPLLAAGASGSLEPVVRVRGQVRGAQRAGTGADDDPRRLVQNRREHLQRAELVRPPRAAARQHHPDRPVHRPTLSRP